MASLFRRGLRRPRVVLTLFAGLAVVGVGAGWLYQHLTRCASAYAYVRGEVVLVGAPIEGQIAAVEVEPGQTVRRGDVLARLKDGGLRAEVDRARAAYERARLVVVAERQAIEVERTSIDANRRRQQAAVSAARARREVAVANALLAERMAGRADRLASLEALPLAEQDSATTVAATARSEAAFRTAEVRSAREDLAAIAVAEAELAARADRVALLEADVESARAALAAAEGRLDLTVIRAQHDGRINRRILAPGASLRIGQPLLEMWLDTPLSVEAWIDETKLHRIRLGGVVRVTFAGLPETFAGRIASIGMVTDEEVKSVSITVPVGNRLAKSRWVRVGVALDHPDPRLMPGVTAEVEVL